MKRTFCISILLSMFFQSCMSWPLLTSLAGLTAGKKGGDSSFFHLLLSNSDPVITRIELSYQDSSIAKGTSTVLEVTAIFDNGTNQNITDSTSIVSDSQTIVDIQGNRVRGIASGSSIIKAEYNGMYSEQKITVTPATLNSIQVTSLDDGILPKGTNRQFAAIGIFSDGSHQDISDDPLIVWSSSNINLVRVDDSGLASGINLGTAHIRASFQSKQASEEITVGDAVLSSIQVTSNNPNIPLGKKQKLTATGIYSDNSNRDISSSVIWNSSNFTIANIQNNGILETADTGIVTVSASSGNITGSIKLIVTPAALVSISVSPTNSSIPKGLTEKFKATGIFTDNSNSDITDQVTWDSSNPDILSISNASANHGLASTLNKGNVKVTASIGGIQGSTDFKVTQEALTSIEVSPVLPSIAKGLTQKFTAIGIFTDNSKKDITDQVTWNSSSAIASVSNLDDNKGLGKAHAAGDTTITATLGKVSGKTWLTVVPAVLTSIQIDPVNPSLAKGLTQKFTATGIYSDNSNKDISSSVTWFSSDSSIATISNAQKSKGNTYGAATGTTNIKATFGKVSSQVSTLSVTAAKLVEIQITPAAASKAKGLSERFKATGIFTDNSNSDITNQVTWSSSNTDIAEITNTSGSKGLTNTLTPGSSEISAALGSIKSSKVILKVTPAQLISIAVTPTNPSVAKGLIQQFKATGTYTDNSVQDVTSLATWSSSNSGKAIVNNVTGSVTTVATGSTNIKATIDSISGSSILNITPALLTSIEITPTINSIPHGLTKQFKATGIFSDKSTQNLTRLVTWISSDPSKIEIENNSGIATAAALGSSNITAVYQSFQSSPTPITVTDLKLKSITINPSSSSIAKGLTQQFKAIGTFIDGSEQEITNLATWYSSKSDIVPINNSAGKKGLATALSIGSSDISAIYNSISSNKINFNVSAATLDSIKINPVNNNIAKGLTQQYTALGVYSDSTIQDISDSVTWSSSNSDSISISNSTGTKGKATALQIGNSKITATYNSISENIDLTVSAATLSSISISPTNTNINAAVSKQFFAAGTYSDGTKTDLTSSVTWSSSNQSQAKASNASETKGLVTGITSGNPIITATYGSVSGNTVLTVNKTDTIAPTVQSVVSLSPTIIQVVYSESINNQEALNLSNYKIIDSSNFYGHCSDNTDFSSNSQTSDFSLSSIKGSKNTFTITLSHSQILNKSYTLVVNKQGIHDLSSIPNSLSCPNNSDFMGKEQLKLTSAVCNSLNQVIVSFSKPLYSGKETTKSVECSNPSQCESRYKFAGVSSLGSITSVRILDGKVCGGAPADSSKICLTHSLLQSGGQYTIIAANDLNGDGFDNKSWGAIRDSFDQENLQSSPKDRINFIGCGNSPLNFMDGPIVSDPFGDGSDFGSLVDYNNQIYLGPNVKGNQASRFNYDGTFPESIFFSFTKDKNATNRASSRDGGIPVPNYVTIGHTSCTLSTADITTGCGPDNEDGRGVFATGSLNKKSHIFIAGSKPRRFNYLYYSSDTDTNLNFKYISMGKITGLATAGTSSIAVLDDRIHVGFAKRNQNLNAPDFGKITFNTSDSKRCTFGNNCDASDGYRGNRFRIDRMPYFGGGSEDLVGSEKQKIKFRWGSLDITPGPIVHKTKVNVKENRLNKLNNSSINWGYYVGIDSLFVFKEKLYAANGGFPNSLHNGSIIRSTGTNPSPCEGINRCSSWKDTAPRSNPKWHNSPHNNWFSLELTKYRDLIPADKAFSQFAEFNGRLYVTRTICVTKEDHSGLRQSLQTVKGCTDGSYTNRRPQLWKCDPTLTGDTTTCEAEDWSLVGDNGTGFTNFGDDSNHSMTMVVASGSYLYVGFDNENGIQIWRTNLENPGSSSHNWEPIGIGGLRDVTNRQIYSAISGMNFGVNFVYISVGSKDQPVKIYRQQNQ
ncbi:Ig-like domain-containing protein [Leptospira kirschneri]|uniref:Bacterial Ig-like domain, group 2 n=1 Tax=Leptospira kirschneri serovar Bulgarica str. Nikolaevo TaxID=1240687 RepID=M6F3M0_9LEPT|nr:Ig-like domain-containing protein [Leptospira kirschneri]EMK20594.1 bacterial Ig-like domain, group 2 [Leptospira kirschneri serovar Bulgarica str. Nikolaevo]